jgi:hypothetical protein
MVVDELAVGLARVLLTGAVVVAASLAAERVGPLVGGVIVSLPVLAGPGYVFLALEAPDDFIAETALASLAVMTASAAFLTAYVRAAPHMGALPALAIGYVAWCAAAALVGMATFTWWSALLANLLAMALGRRLARPPRLHRPIQVKPPSRVDLIARALVAGTLVAIVVALSDWLGPAQTGIFMVMPVTFTSLAWIMHRRYGGQVAAATMAASLFGMLGLVAALLGVHLLARPLGAWWALAAALGLSLLVSAAIVAIARRR